MSWNMVERLKSIKSQNLIKPKMPVNEVKDKTGGEWNKML